jgi:type IV secretory pathway TraG/TraD family ATPase VirD4
MSTFSAAQVKLILGGTDDAGDLRDLSALIGERDDWFTTTSRSAHALAIDASATTSSSLRKVPILPPDAIRSIPFGSAVMLQSQADPFPLRMRRWIDRPDAARIARQQAAVEAELLAAARQRPQHRGADKCAARNGCRHHDAEEVGLTLGRQAASQTSRSGTRRAGCSSRVSPLTVASDLSYCVSSVNTS